jgi:hypothetical protein
MQKDFKHSARGLLLVAKKKWGVVWSKGGIALMERKA